MSAAGPEDAALAVAVSGRRSRRALMWAAENLIPHASRVILIHVIPPVSPVLTSPVSSPSEAPLFSSLASYLSLNNSDYNSGSSSVRHSGADEEDELVSGEVVEAPRRDVAAHRREQTKGKLDSFRKICNTGKEVEIEVLEAEDVAGAILDNVAGLGVKNLVLGCASFRWLNRIVKGNDVPAAVLNSAAATCNVFLVSRRKLILKLASNSISSGFSPTFHIQKVKSTLFPLGESGRRTPRSISLPIDANDDYQLSMDHRRADSLPVNGSDVLNGSMRDPELALLPSIWEERHDHKDPSINNKYPEIKRSQTQPLLSLEYSSAARYTNNEKFQSDAEEVERLKEELRNNFYIFDHVCKELAVRRKKVEIVSAKCSEREMKLRLAQEREEVAHKIAEDEMARRIEAQNEVEEAKKLLVKEALQRHAAEITAVHESREKEKILNALFSGETICRSYSSFEIEVATKNYSEAMKIGEGGYGNVYKCYLDQIPVAIKVLRKDKMENKEQFLREVEVLTRIRHPHVVLLLGVCADNDNECLVYEYMEKGSLDDRLFCKDGTEPLPWATRFRILYDVACTLAFLHSSKPEPIIHCDLKPGNILLDQNYVSKIGDVGLARLVSDIVPDELTEYRDTLITGTPHYMDPEYQRTGTLRPKSDLYSFGIIALQMLTGRRPLGLVLDIENALDDGTFATKLDNSVKGWPLEESERLARIALRCAALRCRDRPDLGSEVIPELEQILNSCDSPTKQNCAPSEYYCPILQDVMNDPYIASDGFTYERHAIEAWLDRHNVSPMTQCTLPDTCILPNLTLRMAIEEWRSRMELSAL